MIYYHFEDKYKYKHKFGYLGRFRYNCIECAIQIYEN